MRTLVLRGDAQAESLFRALSRIAAVTERYELHYFDPRRAGYPPPPQEVFDRCGAFFEQHGDEPESSSLGGECVRLTFPTLSLQLLWPFTCVNAFSLADPPEYPDGRFPYGNAIVVEYLSRGLSREQINAALHSTKWEPHWPNLDDALALETGRLEALDATCDVQIGVYILEHFRERRLFNAPNLPTNGLLEVLLERLLERAFGSELAVPRGAIAAALASWGPRDLLGVTSVPIHPKVAEHFALAWYDPDERYALLDQSLVTYSEYYERMIDESVAVRDARDRKRDGGYRRRIAIVFGNCQADALALTLSTIGEHIKGLQVLYLPSYDKPGGAAPIDESDVRACDVLFEQQDPQQFPLQHLLPPSCARIKFPSLDFNLLWPLGCVNPFNRPEPPLYPQGRFSYGNYLVVNGIEQGKPRDEILKAALSDRWEESWPNLDRLLAIETARLTARDAQCTAKMAPFVLSNFRAQRLFWTVNHPTNWLFAKLCATVLRHAFAEEADAVRVSDVLAGIGTKDLLGIVGVPIHPHVARHFELSWYDRAERLPFFDRAPVSYEEYFTEMIGESLAVAAESAA